MNTEAVGFGSSDDEPMKFLMSFNEGNSRKNVVEILRWVVALQPQNDTFFNAFIIHSTPQREKMDTPNLTLVGTTDDIDCDINNVEDAFRRKRYSLLTSLGKQAKSLEILEDKLSSYCTSS